MVEGDVARGGKKIGFCLENDALLPGAQESRIRFLHKIIHVRE
jgi:hypothetical protein